MSIAESREVLRFHVFELDRDAYELRREGGRVHLEGRPMDALILLVERHGQLVTRHEIIEQLWGRDVFIDVETGINTVIRKIRHVLGDSPDTPVFIETVPGKGYRFVAPVEVISRAASAMVPAPSALVATQQQGGHEAAATRGRLTVALRVAIALAAVATVAAVWLLRPDQRAAPLALTIVPPPGLHLAPVGTLLSTPDISPDGKAVLFTVGFGLYVRRLDSREPMRVPGGDRVVNGAFWSPDSTTVVFGTSTALMKVRLPDGAPETIAALAAPLRGGTWSDAGMILLASGAEGEAYPNALLLMRAAGGEVMRASVIGLDRHGFYYPEFLPGGDDLLFLADSRDGRDPYVCLARLSGGQVVDPVRLVQSDTAARFTPAGGGRILFVRGDNLYAQRLNRRTRRLEGDAELMVTGVASQPGNAVNRADFSVARTGAVAWRPGNAALSQVVTFDREGHQIGTSGPATAVNAIALSPDETRLLALSGDRAWLLEVGRPGRITLPPGVRWFDWTDDGSNLLGIRAASTLVEYPLDGTGIRERAAFTAAFPGSQYDASPDGRNIVAARPRGAGVLTVGTTGSADDRSPRPFTTGPNVLFHPRFSYDGRWLLYCATESTPGSLDLYVQPFPGPGARRQVAPGGHSPAWRADGREIVYLGADGGLWSIDVQSDSGTLSVGVPRKLFAGLGVLPGSTYARLLEVSRDGSRFFFVRPLPQRDTGVIHVNTAG